LEGLWFEPFGVTIALDATLVWAGIVHGRPHLVTNVNQAVD